MIKQKLGEFFLNFQFPAVVSSNDEHTFSRSEVTKCRQLRGFAPYQGLPRHPRDPNFSGLHFALAINLAARPTRPPTSGPCMVASLVKRVS